MYLNLFDHLLQKTCRLAIQFVSLLEHLPEENPGICSGDARTRYTLQRNSTSSVPHKKRLMDVKYLTSSVRCSGEIPERSLP